jgi:hypothetical protein
MTQPVTVKLCKFIVLLQFEQSPRTVGPTYLRRQTLNQETIKQFDGTLLNSLSAGNQ